jgi:hypothetical protein
VETSNSFQLKIKKMKKLLLLSIAATLSLATVHAQLLKNFKPEMKALLEASVEKIKGEEIKNGVMTSYQSTLPLTGFKIYLKEYFGDYHISASYDIRNGGLDSAAAWAMMDTMAMKLSRLLYVLVDSKKQPKILEMEKNSVFKPVRKIVLVDIDENIKADIIQSDGNHPDILITIYKYNRKLPN